MDNQYVNSQGAPVSQEALAATNVAVNALIASKRTGICQVVKRNGHVCGRRTGTHNGVVKLHDSECHAALPQCARCGSSSGRTALGFPLIDGVVWTDLCGTCQFVQKL